MLIACAEYPRRICSATDLDGSTNGCVRGADFTTSADSKTGILSFWFRLDGGDGTTQIIFAASSWLGGAADRFVFSRTSGNKLSITAQDSGGVSRLSIATSASVTSGGAWHHLLSSWD